MPRKRLIRSNIYPYHITGRCNNKDPFPLPLKCVWNIFANELNQVIQKFNCRVHAFVLMPNHFHLLMTTERDDLGVVMQTLMISLTKQINKESRRSGRIFGSRYHWSIIDNEHYFDCALKYVYRNPTKAGLAETVQNYEYSTLLNLFSLDKISIPLSPAIGHSDVVPEGGLETFLQWLNQPFPNEQYLTIKAAFQKTRFKLPKPNWKRKSLSFN